MELCLSEASGAETRIRLLELCERVRTAGGRAFAVGGCVRDSALDRPAKDIDVEVFGLSPEALGDLLVGSLHAHRVGRSFPIFHLHPLGIDVAVPRRAGSREAWDDTATPESAALRRDFTCNAVALDPLTGEVIDPLKGLADLRAGVLRHASERFGEDPLRVLRAMQLVARFSLTPTPGTEAMCRGLVDAELPMERVFGEWRRLLIDGVRIGSGLHFLRRIGGLAGLPELAALVDCPQDPKWHPEGCVFTHTCHALDAFAREKTGDPREDLIVGLAVLCHDLGKPSTTETRDGRITSRQHDQAGVALTRQLLGRWTQESELIHDVCLLVAEHLMPVQLHKGGAGAAAIRRLSRRVGRIDRLVRVARADQFGRPPLPAEEFPAGDWLLQRAAELEVVSAPPIPLLRGRDLIALGLKPGPEFKRILEASYQAQLDGEISNSDEALARAREALGQGDDSNSHD